MAVAAQCTFSECDYNFFSSKREKNHSEIKKHKLISHSDANKTTWKQASAKYTQHCMREKRRRGERKRKMYSLFVRSRFKCLMMRILMICKLAYFAVVQHELKPNEMTEFALHNLQMTIQFRIDHDGIKKNIICIFSMQLFFVARLFFYSLS